MARIVIIGAGLTGISAAYHLEKNNFFEYALFEKDSIIGGLCGSIEQDGFTFDFTGHLLHASDDYFYQLIQTIVGLEHLNVITRRSYIYSHETYTPYPYQINLHGLPTHVIAECIESFIKRKPSKKKYPMFKDWVLENFGLGFGKNFFFPYQEKIFAHDINKITASWTGRFVPSTSLHQIIDGILGKNTDSIGYNARFLYPKKGGILFWVRKLAEQLIKPIHTNFCVRAINMQKKVIYFTNGHQEPYSTLITTMPLDILLQSLHEPSGTRLKKATTKLLCNSVMNFNIGINRPDVSDKHWIYFPEIQYPFYRIGFWHNFSAHMAPHNCSSLYGEFAYLHKPLSWAQQKTNECIVLAKKLFSITDDEIITQRNIPISHAYVIYDRWRDIHLNAIHARLQEHNIYSIGRYGEWKYASMQEAVLDGKKTIEHILFETTKQKEKQTSLQKTIRHKEIHHG